MNGCPEFEERLALHAAGGLAGDERADVERHLATCPACAAELAGIRALLEELAASAPALPPERDAAFARRVRVAAERRRAPRRFAVRAIAGAGALAAAAALALALRATPPAGPATADPVEAAEQALLSDLATLAAADTEAADPIPEPDAGFGLDGLDDDELAAMESLIAAATEHTGG